jgi:hypothetical protein
MIPSFRRIGVVVCTAVLVSGCADAVQPVAPLDAPPSYSSSSSPDLAALARYQQAPQITIAWAKKWIGPEGGRLDFRGFAIEVPAGAVDRVTQFSIKLPVSPQSGSERVVAEFGPHGSQFAVPVAIELPFAGTTLEGSTSATIVWWNDAWVDMGATLTGDGQRLRTLTDHFSTYGTTDDERGGGGAIVASGG